MTGSRTAEGQDAVDTAVRPTHAVAGSTMPERHNAKAETVAPPAHAVTQGGTCTAFSGAYQLNDGKGHYAAYTDSSVTVPACGPIAGSGDGQPQVELRVRRVEGPRAQSRVGAEHLDELDHLLVRLGDRLGHHLPAVRVGHPEPAAFDDRDSRHFRFHLLRAERRLFAPGGASVYFAEFDRDGRAIALFDSYHCSRYNTNTGVLTAAMFQAVFARVRAHVDASARG